MSDCPGIEIAKTSPSGKDWYEVSHCPCCQENAQLREQLAQRTAALRLYGVHHSMCLVNATRSNGYVYWHDGDEATCDCGIGAALAALPDAPVKEKP